MGCSKPVNFELEIDLVDAFRDQLDLFLPEGCSEGLCKTEKRIKGRRFTDLMLGDFAGTIPEVDRKNLPKVTSWLQGQLARATNKPMSPEKMCEGYIPRTQARRRKQITDLVRWGFMTEDENGLVQTTPELLQLLPNQTVAFEAKLHDWKRAVIQAKNYLRFSHSSWVVMPEKFAHHENLITGCQEAKVGLAVVDSTGVTKVVPAAIANDTIPRRTLRFNFLVDFTRHGSSDRWFVV